MRKLVWVLGAVLLAALPVAAQQSEWNPEKGAEAAQKPEHPITEAQVRELMALTGAEHIKKQIVSGMIPYIKQAMPFLPGDVLDDFQARIEKTDFESMVVQSYQAHLSTEDAAQLITFYKSPAGQRVIAAMPTILAESQHAGAQLGEQTMAAVLQAHKPEIERAIQKYKQEHSGAAPQH